MRVRLTPGYQKALAAQPAHRAALRAVAGVVKQRAEGRVRSMFDPGRLSPFMGQRGVDPVQVESDTEGVRVRNTDKGWHLYEYGAVHTPPAAPLRLAARDAGLRLEENERQ